jgi:Ca-activated chloride channel family protein
MRSTMKETRGARGAVRGGLRREVLGWCLLGVLCIAAVLGIPGEAVGQGMLLPRDASLAPITLAEHRVEIELHDHAARTRVTHVFRNPNPRDLEAVFYFAVPPGAATTDFAMWMNGERVRGEVLPRGQARATYESIVRRMRDPGLLEYVDGELFQASIFPVVAGGEQRIEISYATVLAQTSSTVRYAYPIHASAHTGGTLLSFSGEISTSHRISSVYSPWEGLEEILGEDGRTARVGLEQSGFAGGGEFELFVTFTGDDLGFSMLTWEGDDGEPGYFMLTLAASRALEHLDVQPKNITFVVDVSGSMTGPKMQQARALLAHAVRELGPEDRFNVISFSTRVQRLFPESRRADASARSEAQQFIERLQARGNTNISEALEAALAMGQGVGLPHSILFITDGLPTEGVRDIETIVRSAREGASDGMTRIFTFGVGYDVNTRLLEGMARRGRGQSGYVRPDEDISDVIAPFYARIGSPLLTNLEFDFGSVQVTHLVPQPMPDLYRDGPVTLFGRFEARESAPIHVRAFSGDERIELRFAPDYNGMDGSSRDFIGNLWARRRIDALMDEISERGELPALVSEITRLAVRWNIVTPWTSYLAVEPGQPILPDPTVRTTVQHRPAPARGRTGGAEPGRATRSVDDDLSFSVGSARGGGNSMPAAAPRADRAMAASAAMDEGAVAVERERARGETLRDARQVRPQDAAQRTADGRAFRRAGAVWIEAGLEDRRPDRTLTAMSDEWFALIEQHPGLRSILSLGDRVRFRHAGQVWEVR